MLADVKVAKNYLEDEELKVLNSIVSGYFDFAEVQAIRRKPMYMNDYIEHLDSILSATGEQLLLDAGKVSHKEAINKATREYKKYQVQTLSPVEEEYLQAIKATEQAVKKLANKMDKGEK